MAARKEKRLGAAAVGQTYASLGAVATGKVFNVNLHICNVTGASSSLRAYIAAASWTTGEPAGADLVARFAYDVAYSANEIAQISGIVLNAGEKLIVRASVNASLDVIASGVEADA